MTIIQFAIARHAAQIADRVLNGEAFDDSDKAYAAELPHFTAFYEACTVVAKWRSQ